MKGEGYTKCKGTALRMNMGEGMATHYKMILGFYS